MCARSPLKRHLWHTDTFSVPVASFVRDWCVVCGESTPVNISDLDGWSFSIHAMERALDMALDGEEIKAALTRPDVVNPGTHPHQRFHLRGRISLLLDMDNKRIVTILWSAQRRAGQNGKRLSLKDDYFRDN